MRKHDLQIANFVCTFGPDKDLIDYIDEIVIPSFFDDRLTRSYGETSFYVYEPQWVSLGSQQDAELAIIGRFVKDTVLKREQILQNGLLVEDHDEMQSTPSAFFVMLPQDHRLLYFAETAFAPDMSAFASTMQILMRRVWRDLLRRLHNEAAGARTHKELRKEYPMPVLNIVPVAKSDTIDKLMEDFKRIEKIRFRLIRPNQETDASEVFQSVRDRFQPLKPTRLDVEMADSDGLEKGESISAVKEATAGLNTDIIVSGTDDQGNRLKVTNDEFALKVPIEDPAEEVKPLAKQLYVEFIKQIASGSVKRFKPPQHVLDKLTALRGLVL
jgi:hypothetical protein